MQKLKAFGLTTLLVIQLMMSVIYTPHIISASKVEIGSCCESEAAPEAAACCEGCSNSCATSTSPSSTSFPSPIEYISTNTSKKNQSKQNKSFILKRQIQFVFSFCHVATFVHYFPSPDRAFHIFWQAYLCVWRC